MDHHNNQRGHALKRRAPKDHDENPKTKRRAEASPDKDQNQAGHEQRSLGSGKSQDLGLQDPEESKGKEKQTEGYYQPQQGHTTFPSLLPICKELLEPAGTR